MARNRTLIVSTLYLSGLLGAVLVVFLASFLPPELRFAPVIRIPVLILAALVLLLFVGAAWHRTDETAREAHKVAGLWGGGLGLLAGWIGLGASVIASVPVHIARQDTIGILHGILPHEPLMLMMLGALIVMLTFCAGYFVTWATWWLRDSGDHAAAHN